jgi:tape measure domain-containing protein
MAELKLRVSLDTSYLKGQISRLPLEFAGANVSIRPKFDRQAIVSEFRLLNRYIGGKTFDVKIESKTLENLSAKVKNFQERLKGLEGVNIEVGVGVVQSLSPRDARKIKANLRTTVLDGAKKILIPTTVTPKITGKDVDAFKAAVKEKLSGISVDVKANVKGGGFAGTEHGAAGLMKHMAEQGLLGKTASGMKMQMGKDGGDIKQQLNDAVQSAKKIKSVFDGVAESIATTGKSIANVQGKRLGLANVPLMAGAMEKRIERSASAIEGTTSSDALKALYPEISKTIVSLAALSGQVQQNTSKLSGFGLIIGLAAFAGVPLAKSIVKLTGSADSFSKLLDEIGPNLKAAFAKAASNILNTASSRLLSEGNVAGLLPAAYRGIGPSAEPAGLLPPAYRGIEPGRVAGALPPAYRGLPFGFDFKGLPPDSNGAEEAGKGGTLASPEQLKERVDAILSDYFKVIEVRVRNAFDIIGNYHADQLNTFINNYRKILDQYHRNTLIAAARQQVRNVQVSDLPQRPAQAMLPGTRIAGLLSPEPPGRYRANRAEEVRAELLARREREARMRSALRGVDVMGEIPARAPARYSYANRPAMPRRPTSAIVPYEAGGAMVYSGPGGGMPPGGGAYGGPGNFAQRGGGPGGGFNVPKLPGAGLVREIGQEFAFATKQVLLFGSAYKALAFLQSFPTQVGAAVGALQSFRNTLNAISPTAADAAASNQLIIDTVDKYNIPIQSARDGFTKLYASMKPAGFSGNQIGDLFLGISKASATLGLSSDKVDRVTYAFSQMASKGQLMSEEVSGQLGDVIPGALSIMAEAANMDIKTFKKAMEDGVFVGKEFEAVMSNVPIVLEKRFGKGAEGAAKTFQGAINNMQTSLTLFYEAFEPVAVGFLNAVVKPISAGLQTLTDGFNTFFTGQAAQTAAGNAFAEQLNNLRPSFEGIRTNLAALIPSLQTFGQLLLSVAQFLASVAGNPITGFLLKVYANVLLVNAAFSLLGGKILLGLIVNINAAIIRLVAFGYAINAVGIQTTGANTALAGTQLQMMLLQRNAAGAVGPVTTLLGSLLRLAAIGTIAIGVTIVVNGLMQMKEAEAILARLRGEKNPVGPSGPRPVATAARRYTGATREKVIADQQKQQEIVAELRNQLKTETANLQTGRAAAAVGAGGRILERTASAKVEALKIKIKDAEDVLNLDPNKYQTAAAKQRASVTTMANVAGGGGGGGGAKPKEERESQVPMLKLELQYQKELLPLESEINRARLLDNNLSVIRLENEKNMLDLKYEASRINLEDIPVAEKRLKIETLQAKGQMAALKTRYDIEFEIAKILEEHDKTLENMEEKSNLELLNRKSYIELLLNGIRPAYAKITIEVENEIAALTKSLELRKLNLEQEIKLLQAKKAGGGKIDEDRLTDLQTGLGRTIQRLADLPAFGTGETARRLAIADAPKLSQEYMAEGLEAAQDRLKELTNTGYQVVQAANAIGDAFGEAFKGVITGSMTAREALAGFFQSVADSFADMVSQMIAEYLKIQIMEGMQNLLKMFAPAIGAAAGAIGGGLSSGFNAGTSSAIDTGAAGWASSFATPLKLANGGIAPGGFTAFANGGIVTGPTLGLVGEGRYNEAVIPLPDGKSVPVQLSGGDGGNQINSNITVNVSNGQAQSNASGSNSSELGRKIEGAVKQVIVGELRPGGLLASR